MLNRNHRLKNFIIISFEIILVIIAYFLVKYYAIEKEGYFFEVMLFAFIFSNLIIWFYLEKRDRYLLKLQKQLASENHINNTIFNLQKAIIVVRDEVSMSQANNIFFETFDFKDIEDFSSKHICICELFVEKEGVPHTLPIMEGMNWAEYIVANPEKTHHAYMIDKYGDERIYTIDLRESVFENKAMVVFTEITDIKNQMETFHTLFNSSVDGLILLQDNQFIDVNKALLQMIGCESKEEFLELTPKALLPLKQMDGRVSIDVHNEMVEECLRNGVSSRQRIQLNLLGEEFWCEVAMTRIKLNQKDAIYVRWRDIHEYKLLEFSLENEVKRQAKVLVASSRLSAIGEMMENITHQWKQPLSVILNLANILKSEQPDSKELSIILDQTKYLNNTIADFKNFSSISNNDKASFDLLKSIESTLKIFQFNSETHNIDILLDIEKNMMIKGDMGKFNQALLVILSNAKDAFIENNISKRVISLHAWKKNKKTYITISDNAGGVPLKIINKIFEPYFTTKFKDKGTGIGLSMTYNIIKQMQGTIEVQNNKSGAIFTIVLPKL